MEGSFEVLSFLAHEFLQSYWFRLCHTCTSQVNVHSVHCLHSYILFGAETNQELIMAQGGIGLLARTADDAEDPQTLRMVAGAIANLCGNGTSTLNNSI